MLLLLVVDIVAFGVPPLLMIAKGTRKCRLPGPLKA